MPKYYIVAPSAEKGRTSRTKRVYFKRTKKADMESILFKTMKIENNMGDPVFKAAFVTEDQSIIDAFKVKKGFKIVAMSEEVKKDLTITGNDGGDGGSGNDDLDEAALKAKYEELFGNKPPGNILLTTLAKKIAEKEAELE